VCSRARDESQQKFGIARRSPTKRSRFRPNTFWARIDAKKQFELHDDKDKANTAIRSEQFGQGLRGDCPDLAQEFGGRAKLFELDVWFLFQERIDAENSEIVERASGP
jgi:hypothetical protein